MDLKDVKLVIWDLDETLWEGVLSDGEVVLSASHKELIKGLVDHGILCSICSKNDEAEVYKELEKTAYVSYLCLIR